MAPCEHERMCFVVHTAAQKIKGGSRPLIGRRVEKHKHCTLNHRQIRCKNTVNWNTYVEQVG